VIEKPSLVDFGGMIAGGGGGTFLLNELRFVSVLVRTLFF
jgi:hypothetical protein